tara:strand:+ start:816 stop:1067 length:252 start_codon:yes stop_codon:yes gene_type:complete
MNDILEFIDELKEMQALYNNGDLRNYDFESKIQKYERMVDEFEAEIEREAMIADGWSEIDNVDLRSDTSRPAYIREVYNVADY